MMGPILEGPSDLVPLWVPLLGMAGGLLLPIVVCWWLI